MDPRWRLLPGHPQHQALLPAARPTGSRCLVPLYVGFPDRAQLEKEEQNDSKLVSLEHTYILLHSPRPPQGLKRLKVPLDHRVRGSSRPELLTLQPNSPWHGNCPVYCSVGGISGLYPSNVRRAQAAPCYQSKVAMDIAACPKTNPPVIETHRVRKTVLHRAVMKRHTGREAWKRCTELKASLDHQPSVSGTEHGLSFPERSQPGKSREDLAREGSSAWRKFPGRVVA